MEGVEGRLSESEEDLASDGEEAVEAEDAAHRQARVLQQAK